MTCNHVFFYHSVIPPTRCPTCGACLTCGSQRPWTNPAPYKYSTTTSAAGATTS